MSMLTPSAMMPFVLENTLTIVSSSQEEPLAMSLTPPPVHKLGLNSVLAALAPQSATSSS